MRKQPSHEKEWMSRKKSLWEEYKLPQKDGKLGIPYEIEYEEEDEVRKHSFRDRTMDQPTTTLSTLELSGPKKLKKNVWVHKKVGNEWKKVRFYVKLRDWDHNLESSDSNDDEGPLRSKSAHILDMPKQQKKQELAKMEHEKIKKTHQVIVYKLKWNRIKVAKGRRWKPVQSLQELSHDAKEYDTKMRFLMIPARKAYDKWSVAAKKRFGIKDRRNRRQTTINPETEYADDDSLEDLSSISSRFSLPSLSSIHNDYKKSEVEKSGKRRPSSAHAILKTQRKGTSSQSQKRKKSITTDPSKNSKSSVPFIMVTSPRPIPSEGSTTEIFNPSKHKKSF